MSSPVVVRHLPNTSHSRVNTFLLSRTLADTTPNTAVLFFFLVPLPQRLPHPFVSSLVSRGNTRGEYCI